MHNISNFGTTHSDIAHFMFFVLGVGVPQGRGFSNTANYFTILKHRPIISPPQTQADYFTTSNTKRPSFTVVVQQVLVQQEYTSNAVKTWMPCVSGGGIIGHVWKSPPPPLRYMKTTTMDLDTIIVAVMQEWASLE